MIQILICIVIAYLGIGTLVWMVGSAVSALTSPARRGSVIEAAKPEINRAPMLCGPYTYDGYTP
jgi:hypothetical protein